MYTEATYGLLGGGRGGGRRGAYLWIVRPFVAPTRKDQSQNNVREVGTPPVRSTLRTPQHALSTVVKNSHKVRTETEAKDCPTHCESPAPPPSFNSCEEQSQSPNGNWSKRLSNSLRESSPTSLFQQLWRTVTKSERKLKQKTVQLTARVQPRLPLSTVVKNSHKVRTETEAKDCPTHCESPAPPPSFNSCEEQSQSPNGNWSKRLSNSLRESSPTSLFQQLWRTVTKSERKLKQKTVQLTARVQPHLPLSTVVKNSHKVRTETEAKDCPTHCESPAPPPSFNSCEEQSQSPNGNWSKRLSNSLRESSPASLFQQLWRTVTKSERKLKQKTVQLTARVQPRLPLSTVVKNSHKVRTETEAKDCPTHCESPAPPPSFNSCEEQSQSPNGNWSKRLSNSLRESSPASLFQQLWRTVTKSERKLKQKTVQLTTRVQPRLPLSTVVKNSHKVRTETEAKDCPTHYESPAPPPSFNSCEEQSQSPNGNWSKRLSNSLRESSPTSLFQQLWRTVTKSERKLKQKTVQLTARVQPRLPLSTVVKNSHKVRTETEAKDCPTHCESPAPPPSFNSCEEQSQSPNGNWSKRLSNSLRESSPASLFQQLWRTVTKSERKLKQKTVQLTARVQPRLPLSTVVKNSHKVRTETEAKDCPTHYESPAPPPSFNSCEEQSQSPNGNWSKRLSNSLRESSPASLFQQLWRTVTKSERKLKQKTVQLTARVQPHLPLSTVVKNSHKVRTETEAKDCPTHCESPAPPPSFNSCEEQSQSPNGNWSKRLSNSLRESSPTSLFQQLWRTVTKSERKLKQKTVQLTARVQPRLPLSTVVKNSHKVRTETEAKDCPTHCESPAPPPSSGRSCALHTTFPTSSSESFPFSKLLLIEGAKLVVHERERERERENTHRLLSDIASVGGAFSVFPSRDTVISYWPKRD